MPTLTTITDEIFTVAEFFSPDECVSLIRLAESAGFSDAPINTSVGPAVRGAARNNTRVIVDDPSRANALWQRLADLLPHPIENWVATGINERFRYYRYEVGQQFNWHRDGQFRRANGELSLLTFIVYLNDDLAAGILRLTRVTSFLTLAWRCSSITNYATKDNQSHLDAST